MDMHHIHAEDHYTLTLNISQSVSNPMYRRPCITAASRPGPAPAVRSHTTSPLRDDRQMSSLQSSTLFSPATHGFQFGS
jgi:hypothetical protein